MIPLYRNSQKVQSVDDIAILLVDGPNAGLADLAALLKRHGYRTQTVSTERDALDALEHREPSLVFIDLRHALADQLCQHLRDTAVGAITPVIMMGTQGANVTSVADALAVGADFYFEASWQHEAVLAKVKIYVGEGGVPVVDAPLPPQVANPELLRRLSADQSAHAANQNVVPPPLPKRAAQTLPHAAALPAEPSTDLTALIQSPAARLQQGPPPRRKPTLVAALVPFEAGSWDATPPMGNLDETYHVAQVLAQASMAQASGRMDWQQGDIHVCLWFHEGSPCGYSSNLAHDNLAEFLSRTGSIRHAAYRQLRLQTLPNARLTLAYLVRLGEISTDKIWALMTAHLAEQTYGLFAWEAGSFAWHSDVMPLEDRITLNMPTPGWLLEGLRRKYDMPRLLPHVGGGATMVARTTACEALVPNLHVGSAEAHMISLLDGTRTLEDIASSCQTPIIEVYRVVLLLVMLRHAQVTHRGSAGLQGGIGAHPTRDTQRITEKLQQTRLCDYFEILGIATSASSFEVDRASVRLQEAFHPNRFSRDVRLQYEAELAEIAEILADAREVLVDQGKRQAYAEHVV